MDPGEMGHIHIYFLIYNYNLILNILLKYIINYSYKDKMIII